MHNAESLFLILPAQPGAPVAWLRARGDQVLMRGKDWASDGFAQDGARCIALVPVEVTGLARVDLPALAPAQAAAAARLALADRLALEDAPVHLAVARGEGLRAACWVREDWLAQWQSDLAAQALVPDALWPAACVLEPGDTGFVRFALGESVVVAGGGTAWPDSPALNAAMDAPTLRAIDRAEVEAALLSIDAARIPDLGQRGFARRQHWQGAWGEWRWVAGLAAALLLISALIPVAQGWARHRAADHLDGETRRMAQAAFPGAADPLAAMAARGSGGLAAPYAALAKAVSDVAEAELGTLTLRSDGVIETRVRVPGVPARDQLVQALRLRGYSAEASEERTEQGRLSFVLRMGGA